MGDDDGGEHLPACLRVGVRQIVLVTAAAPARADDFASGSIIIPMDTDFQDDGMLKAFGLLDALLRADVPINWVIKTPKVVVNAAKGQFEADFTASAKDFLTGSTVAAHAYRGGPFVIAAADAALASPIITTWQKSSATTVHVATAPFTANVSRRMTQAPRIAILADGNQNIAFNYLNAAGILDEKGNAWSNSSPDVLAESAVAGTSAKANDGALFRPSGQPGYCEIMTMHWNVNSTSIPDVVAELGSFLQFPVHVNAECQAVNAIEGTPPAGGRANFVTSAGFQWPAPKQPATVEFENSSLPFAQMDGPFVTVGGSEPAYGLGPGSMYFDQIVMVKAAGLADGIQDVWMTGYAKSTTCRISGVDCVENGKALGKVSYLGGHQYDTKLPMSKNGATQGTRLFLNSLYEADCVTAQPSMSISKSAPSGTTTPTITYAIALSNTGHEAVLDFKLVDPIPAGATFVSADAGGTFSAGVVTWNLGDPKDYAATVHVTVTLPGYGTYTNTASGTFTIGLNTRHVKTNAASTLYAACLTGADCPATAPTCDGGTHTCRGCTAGSDCPGSAPACQSSGQCGACSATNIGLCGGATPACDTTTATCVPCVTSSQCPGAAPVCNTTTKTCVGCLMNADCGGATPVCDPALLMCRGCGGDSECVGTTPACQPSGACGQCSAANSLACGGATPVCDATAGACVRCLANADCAATTPFCNGVTHTCQACVSDAQCGGATPACQPSGVCGLCSATNATACGGATPVCNPTTATCVACTSNAQCAGTTPTCDPATLTCRACASDGDCGGATPACNTATGSCVGCLSNAGCGGTTPVCTPTSDSCRACMADGECAAATPACQPSGACGQCSAGNATRCTGARPVCDPASGLCVACTSTIQCGGTTPVCDLITHTCAPCASDSDCGGATPACQPSGACGQCSAAQRSTCGGATPACDISTGTCGSCVSSADCSGTTPVCSLTIHSCRPCASDANCGGATPACQPNGACGQCSATNAARCGGVASACDVATGACVPCTSNAQCGGITPVCNLTTHACRGCAGDADCGGSTPACQPSGACGVCSTGNSSACTGPTADCDVAAGICRTCDTGAQCGGTTPICDATTHTCRGCASDRPCAGATPACQPSGACAACSATASSACTGATPVCDLPSGTCVACLTSAECAPARPICDATTHSCRGCSADGECGGATPACQPGGACGACSVTNTTMCAGPAPLCDTARGACVGCQAAADCRGDTPVCDSLTRVCRACSSSVDCPQALPVCSASGACVQCAAGATSACPGSKPVCDTGTTTCRGCAAGAECGAAAPLCLGNGVCATCTPADVSRCLASAARCDTAAGGGTCVGCLDDSQCGGVTPFCSPVTRTCIACTADGAPSCSDPARPVCQRSGPLAGACSECSATNAALCTGLKPQCLGDAGICGCSSAGAGGACGVDQGLVCSGPGGFCVPGCDAQAGQGCSPGSTCVVAAGGAGRCSSGAGCTSDASCVAPLSRCDASVAGGQCVQCLLDADCPTRLVCDSSRKTCVECAAGHAEACRPDLTGGRCLTGGQCGCVSDGDCGGATSGRVCDAATARCVPGCRGTGGNACPVGQSCSSVTSNAGRCQTTAAPDGGLTDAGVIDAPVTDGPATGDSAGDSASDGAVSPDAAADRDAGQPGPDAGRPSNARYNLAGGGCTCSTEGTAPHGWVWSLTLLFLAAGRRRSRKPSGSVAASGASRDQQPSGFKSPSSH